MNGTCEGFGAHDAVYLPLLVPRRPLRQLGGAQQPYVVRGAKVHKSCLASFSGVRAIGPGSAKGEILDQDERATKSFTGV